MRFFPFISSSSVYHFVFFELTTQRVVTDKSDSKIKIELPKYPLPVLFSSGERLKPIQTPKLPFPIPISEIDAIPSEDASKLAKLLKKDILYEFSSEEKSLIWKYRRYFKSDQTAIIPILHSAPWDSAVAVKSIHRYTNHLILNSEVNNSN